MIAIYHLTLMIYGIVLGIFALGLGLYYGRRAGYGRHNWRAGLFLALSLVIALSVFALW